MYSPLSTLNSCTNSGTPTISSPIAWRYHNWYFVILINVGCIDFQPEWVCLLVRDCFLHYPSCFRQLHSLEYVFLQQFIRLLPNSSGKPSSCQYSSSSKSKLFSFESNIQQDPRVVAYLQMFASTMATNLTGISSFIKIKWYLRIISRIGAIY